MAKIKKVKNDNDIIDSVAAHTEAELFKQEDIADVEAPQTRTRRERRKTYVRPTESDIPQSVANYFAKDDYELRWVRWSVNGEPSYKYLNHRELEGYEFVTVQELPKEYVRTLRIRDTQVTKGLVTNGADLCLMKIDKDLRQSRREFLETKAQEQLDAVNNYVKEKGLRTTGSRSSVVYREPVFRD